MSLIGRSYVSLSVYEFGVKGPRAEPQGISRSKPKSFKSCMNLSILWISVATASNSTFPLVKFVPSSCSSSNPLRAVTNSSFSDYGAASKSLLISSYYCSTYSSMPSVPPPLPCLGRTLNRLNNGILIKNCELIKQL